MTERAAVLQWTTELAAEAGERARMMLAEERTISHKADGTIVTNIDRAIERFLRERIGARFPDHAILGEEYGFEGDTTAPLWALDPVDGTTNLAHGLPQWGVSIGLVEAGVPVVGAVCFPLLAETYAGARGLGATRNGAPLPPLAREAALQGEDIYGICSYSVQRMIFAPIVARLRLTGSAALDACWTASGAFRGSQSLGVKLYDVAAALCIAHETGARSVWLKTGEPWSALDMLQNGKRENDLLLTAVPTLIGFLRENLTLPDA
jgi:myo-inositol-1(or 4)-monophosphatase